MTTELLLGWENSNLQRLAWECMGGRAEERCWRERPKSGEAQNVVEFILRHKNTWQDVQGGVLYLCGGLDLSRTEHSKLLQCVSGCLSLHGCPICRLMESVKFPNVLGFSWLTGELPKPAPPDPSSRCLHMGLIRLMTFPTSPAAGWQVAGEMTLTH